jgi:hypothetical protein
MTFDQIIGLSGLPLFILFFLNYIFMVYVVTYKFEEIQNHFVNSRFVNAHRSDANTPMILRPGSLVLIWSLLVFRFFKKMDPQSIEEVKTFPRRLRPRVIIPGYLNAICILWVFIILVWINVKDYL